MNAKRALVWTIAPCVFLACVALFDLPAKADTTGSWAGTVSYINSRHIGVKSGQQTRDFMIPPNFSNVHTQSGESQPLSAIATGSYVTVQFTRSPLFGSTTVTDITLSATFTLPTKVSPTPTVSPQ